MKVKKTLKKPNPRAKFLPHPGPGRTKGIPNKLSRTAKENIEKVYGELGDVKGHVEFLKTHPAALADFYSNVYSKLIPLDVSHSGEVRATVIFEMPRPVRTENQR